MASNCLCWSKNNQKQRFSAEINLLIALFLSVLAHLIFIIFFPTSTPLFDEKKVTKELIQVKIANRNLGTQAIPAPPRDEIAQMGQDKKDKSELVRTVTAIQEVPREIVEIDTAPGKKLADSSEDENMSPDTQPGLSSIPVAAAVGEESVPAITTGEALDAVFPAVVKGGEGDSGAHALKLCLGAGQPRPEYPAMARRWGMEGVARLEVSVRQDGGINRVKLLQSSGHRLLDQVAIRTVTEKWRCPASGQKATFKKEFVFRLYQ